MAGGADWAFLLPLWTDLTPFTLRAQCNCHFPVSTSLSSIGSSSVFIVLAHSSVSLPIPTYGQHGRGPQYSGLSGWTGGGHQLRSSCVCDMWKVKEQSPWLTPGALTPKSCRWGSGWGYRDEADQLPHAWPAAKTDLGRSQ